MFTLQRMAVEWAVVRWNDIDQRYRGRRAFCLPGLGSRPAIRKALRAAPKHIVARSYQLARGHGMATTFIRDRWGWIDSDEF